MASDALDPQAWRSAVHVAVAERLQDEIIGRHALGPLEGSVSVTELLDPRPGYWGRVRPVPPTPERQARMRTGQEMHVLAGHLLAPAAAREVRVRRDSIVARIDLLDDRVTELKTTSLRPMGGVPAVRRSYLDQLAVYCGILDRGDGRLVLLDPDPDVGLRAEVYEAEYPRPTAAWSEAGRRAGLLRDAWRLESPSGLPRCPWRDRGCEYQQAAVCDCTGEEARSPADSFGPPPALIARPDAAASLIQGFSAGPDAPDVRRFRDLLYPRRAYFERSQPSELDHTPSEVPTGPRDLWRTLSDILETGVAGDVASVLPPSGLPLERVVTLSGAPLLLKTSRGRNPWPADRLVDGQSQYVLELGLRCAALGTAEGVLIVGYERIEPWERKVHAFRIRFDPLEPFSVIWEARTSALRAALVGGTPRDLPRCPGWMFETCPYRAECGCVPAAGADHR